MSSTSDIKHTLRRYYYKIYCNESIAHFMHDHDKCFNIAFSFEFAKINMIRKN